MVRETGIGVCEHCHTEFSYYLVHNGFNDSAYAYCDTCEQCTILTRSHKPIPPGAGLSVYQRISNDVESFLKPCPCGGMFRADADPRCLHCRQVLSPVLVRKYLEGNAPGTKKGWKWQNNWSGIYSIVIANKCVNDCWKLQ